MASSSPPKRGRPRDESLPERRREEILDAAAGIFARSGYPNTEIQQVADALGIAKGTIYRYFESKEVLFLATVDRGMRRLKEAVDAALVNVDDSLAGFEAALQAYLRFFKDHREYVELLVQERAEFRDRKKSTYFEHRDANRCMWDERFTALIAAGRVRPMPISRIMDTLADVVYGAMFTNYFTGRHKPLDEQTRDIVDIVFNGILTPTERRRRDRSSKAE